MTLPLTSRRQFLGAVAASAAYTVWPRQAFAQSFHTFRQGAFEITVLNDGFFLLPGDIFAPEATKEQRADIVRRLGGHDDAIEAKSNIPVIRRGSDLIIVDVGAGRKYQATEGELAAGLRAAGVDPAVVTKVVFTHAHPDHIWGTLAEDGELRFPNATYYVGSAEWEFWMDPDYLSKMPLALHDFARGAQRDLGAIRDRVVMLKPGDDVVTGMRALDTAGHTPGHLSFELTGGDGLIITADATTNEIASFEHPGWKFGYDMIPDLAIANRARLVERAATDKVKLLGYHWTYPGVGYAERKGSGIRFVSAA